MKHKLGIIGGCGSSGTTLLTHLLSRSPYLASGPEFNCFNHREFFDFSTLRANYKKMFEGHCVPDGYIDVHVFITNKDYYGINIELFERWIESSIDIESFFKKLCNHMASRFKAPFFVEKSPTNIYSFYMCSAALPDIPLIHVIRDGRDVVTSLSKRGFNLFGAGSRWLYDTLAGLNARGSKSYLEVRYEDLVRDPVRTLDTVFTHLNIPFDPEIIHKWDESTSGVFLDNWKNHTTSQVWKQVPSDSISTASIGRYKNELEKMELSTLYKIRLTDAAKSKLETDVSSFSELLELLGYDVDDSPVSAKNRYSQRKKEMQYEFQDYCRRVWRFWNHRYMKLPCRYTRILC